MYSSLPFPEPFQYRFTLVTTASFNLDKRFAARRIICGLPPLTALSGNIFLILMSFAFLFHAEALRTPARASLRDSLSLGGYPRALPRFPTTTTSSDYCFRFRYSQFSQVPLQNFRDALGLRLPSNEYIFGGYASFAPPRSPCPNRVGEAMLVSRT